MTCGLQNSDSPSSDKVTPQESTTQNAGTDGADKAGLSCTGSRVVAERGQDNSEFIPLIKSSTPELPQDTQENQDDQFQSSSEDEA